MPSTYTTNLGIELPADGELDGVWGDVVNENMDILDRAINGVLSLSLSGTSSTLTTSDGALSDGQNKLLLLIGSPSATHTITIAPNDAEKIYFVRNGTGQSVIFTQGSGSNVTIATGDSGIIYSDGGGAGANVRNLTDTFAMSSVNITGGSITGLADLGLSSAGPFIDFAETDTTDKDARISLSAGTLVFDTRTDADVLVQENMRIASNGNVGIGTAADADTKLEVSSNTNPTAVFIAYISGTTMTVTGITSGALAVGDRVFGAGVEWNTVITAQTSGTTGASGNYTVNNSQTVSVAPTGIAMSSGNAGRSVLRLTNTDTSEVEGQTTGAVEFFSSDASAPGAGVKGYVAVIAEDTSPDSAMIFGTSNDTASTLAVERMRITSTGDVGIGTANPASTLDVNGNLTITDKIIHSGDTDTAIRFPAADTVTVETAGDERMRITSAGNVGIGVAAPTVKLAIGGAAAQAVVYRADNTRYAALGDTGATDDGGVLLYDTADALQSVIRAQGNSYVQGGNFGIGKNNPAVALDVAGAANFTGQVTLESTGPALIFQETDTTNVDGRFRRQGGDFIFETITDAGVLVRENFSIESSNQVSIGGTVVDPASSSDVGFTFSSSNTLSIARSASGALNVGRQTDDGTLVTFRQAGTSEGTISVSGTTVSYNGGHLSRWAQLPDNSRPDLLKGTVMSNLDQMSNWNGEDNEQLNCVQVSTAEGDANVAGVFVAWDSEDDGYNDILLAMTGDMVIRIAAGTTVQRGDLLMSAGDGTAKPQGDDIVRAKTIAKVTSTYVSETYADGSYVVPCVLMAC